MMEGRKEERGRMEGERDFRINKPVGNIKQNGEKLKIFPLKSGTKQVLARAIIQQKEIKKINTGKEDVKVLLFVHYMDCIHK